MSILSRFKAIDENGKSQAVRRLLETSTPDFDYFYMVALSVAMAVLGLLIDSPAIVIGSMLIAPVLFPLLSLSLGLVMSDYGVLARSLYTLGKSFTLGLVVAIGATLLLAPDASFGHEILSRTQPSLLYLFVAVSAGLAVSFALAKPEWNETLPGIAVSVALLPPLAVLGIGIAQLDLVVISGSFVLLLVNVVGIVIASMISFSLMDLREKRHVAKSTLKKETEKMQEEKKVVEEIDEEHKRQKKEAMETKRNEDINIDDY